MNKKPLTAISLLFFILIPILAIPATTYSPQEAMINKAAASAIHPIPSESKPLIDDQSLANVRFVAAKNLQQATVPAFPSISPNKDKNLSLLKTEYILFAIGIIGYIVVRRRPNIGH